MPDHYNRPGPPPPPAIKPPKRPEKSEKSAFDEQKTDDAAGKPLPGTGSRYTKDGKKRKDLGVGWGP